MSLPDSYFDVAPAAHDAGYRVMFLRAGVPTKQEIFRSASDVAAAARLCDAAVLTRDLDIRAACRDRCVWVLSTEERV